MGSCCAKPWYVYDYDLKTLPEFVIDVREGKVLKVYDGDTIAIAAKPYDQSPVCKFLVRFNGIESPEIRRQSPFLMVIPPPSILPSQASSSNLGEPLSPRSISPLIPLEIQPSSESGTYISPSPSQSPTPSDPMLKGEGSPRDGVKVRELLSQQILGQMVHLNHCSYDKSGHIYADVLLGQLNLSQWLLDLKVVWPIEGHPRKQWPEIK